MLFGLPFQFKYFASKSRIGLRVAPFQRNPENAVVGKGNENVTGANNEKKKYKKRIFSPSESYTLYTLESANVNSL